KALNRRIRTGVAFHHKLLIKLLGRPPSAVPVAVASYPDRTAPEDEDQNRHTNCTEPAEPDVGSWEDAHPSDTS
ncbi:hypothetical protein, partial [Phaeobacter sp. 11ANDIMAR09]|uniref:hypothetical protein n=1 Tax=Phaeobacter sp. 11ANDIMAR09 TaxID=1225647 RepID=UPI0020A1FFF7